MIGLGAGPAAADQNDPRLGLLFDRLLEAPDPGAAQEVAAGIWQIWFETDDAAVRILMKDAAGAMGRGDARTAMRAYDQVVAIAPGFAEGWNMRATLNYMIGAYESSLADIEKTLMLEPRHFGALSGRGLVYTELKDWELALHAFEQALKVHPRMPGARISAEAIRQTLENREI